MADAYFRPASEVCTVEVLFRIRRKEIHAIQFKSRASGGGLIAENGVPGSFAAKQGSGELITKRTAFIIGDTGLRPPPYTTPAGIVPGSS